MVASRLNESRPALLPYKPLEPGSVLSGPPLKAITSEIRGRMREANPDFYSNYDAGGSMSGRPVVPLTQESYQNEGIGGMFMQLVPAYEQAIRQGYQGTFQDFMNQINFAGR